MKKRGWTRPADARPRDRYRAGKRLWSAVDDALVRRRYPDVLTEDLARQLRRTPRAVHVRAKNMGVKKSHAFLSSASSGRIRREDHRGRQFWFPKGHPPANKGTRRPGWFAGRMRETQFKKGQLPHNSDPDFYVIGALRVNTDGYVDMRVSFEQGGKGWRGLHRLLWEDARGPIPRGSILVFKDGDRLNVELDNLQLITLRENMRRNTVHNLPKPLAQAVQLLGAINRQIRRREQHP